MIMEYIEFAPPGRWVDLRGPQSRASDLHWAEWSESDDDCKLFIFYISCFIFLTVFPQFIYEFLDILVGYIDKNYRLGY